MEIRRQAVISNRSPFYTASFPAPLPYNDLFGKTVLLMQKSAVELRLPALWDQNQPFFQLLEVGRDTGDISPSSVAVTPHCPVSSARGSSAFKKSLECPFPPQGCFLYILEFLNSLCHPFTFICKTVL